MWWGKFGKTTAVTVLAVMVASMGGAAVSVSTDQRTTRPGQEVRTIWTGEFGLPRPSSLTYVASNRQFLVTQRDSDSALLVGSNQEPRLIQIPASNRATAVAWNPITDRVLFFGDSIRGTLTASELGSASIRWSQSTSPSRSQIGAAIDPASGELVVLNDAGELTRLRSAGSQAVNSTIGDARAVAFNPTDGLLYVLDGGTDVVAIDAAGRVDTTYDLSDVGLLNPTAMAFAPSSDPTDDPTINNLFIASAGNETLNGGITEISLAAVVAATAPVDSASLVNTIYTSTWSPAAPDPSGVAYQTGTGHLFVVDSEVDEVTGAGWHNVNLWRTTRAGSVVSTGTFWGSNAATYAGKIGYSREPTGVGYDPGTNTMFVSDDSAKKVFVIRPGADLAFGTSDDVVGSVDSGAYGSGDTEDPEFDTTTGDLFFLDGVGREIYRVDPVDDVFGNGNDVMTHFDISQLGPVDFEGLTSDPARGTLYVGARTTKQIFEITKDGTLLRTISLSGITGLRYISGLAVAPASNGSTQMHFWVVDRAVDNGADSNENDGKLFEVAAPDSIGGVTNQAPVVNAGPDQTITLPNSATLTGTVTDDGLPQGATVTQTWSTVTKPSGSTVTFANPTSTNTTATFSTNGTYTLRLTATDTQLTSSDDIVVQVGGEALAVSEATRFGTVAGTLTDTYTDDGIYEQIIEQPYSKNTRTKLEHRWTFQINGGNSVQFVVNAFHPGTEDFQFHYSLNGSKWTRMVIVTARQDGTDYTYTMPAGTTGTVYVRVTDTNRSSGDTSLDVINIDRMAFVSVFN